MVAARFRKSQRLRERREFEHVQNGSSTLRAGSRCFLVLVVRRGDAGPARLGVVASRRVGSAVLRNRAKRLVREIFRKNAAANATSWSGIELVIIVKAAVENEELTERSVAAELLPAIARVLAPGVKPTPPPPPRVKGKRR